MLANTDFAIMAYGTATVYARVIKCAAGKCARCVTVAAICNCEYMNVRFANCYCVIMAGNTEYRSDDVAGVINKPVNKIPGIVTVTAIRSGVRMIQRFTLCGRSIVAGLTRL